MSEAADDRAAAVARDRDYLLYDHSKHVLSLALLGIGGIITIAQSPLGKAIPGRLIGILVLMLAASAVFALSCTAAILRSRERTQPLGKSAWLLNQGAMLLLGMGFGAFLATWIVMLF